MSESTTIGDDFPKQQSRVREILSRYHAIGLAGSFGAMMIEADLHTADEALASGDIVRILRAYQILKEIED